MPQINKQKPRTKCCVRKSASRSRSWALQGPPMQIMLR